MVRIKICNTCLIEKDIESFGLAISCIDGRRPKCKSCTYLVTKKWKGLPETKQMFISNTRKYRYGISEERYQEMFEAQGGVCAICRQPETCLNVSGTVKNLSVDHDHNCCPGQQVSCGKCIRALLCAGCNRGLGYFKDDADILMDAVTYLLSQKNIVTEGGFYNRNYR